MAFVVFIIMLSIFTDESSTYSPTYGSTYHSPTYSFAPNSPMYGEDLATTNGLNATEYPGFDEGFERGVDESGNEIYRYESDNQVYIIPANDYYAWRSQYYHGSLTHEVLQASADRSS